MTPQTRWRLFDSETEFACGSAVSTANQRAEVHKTNQRVEALEEAYLHFWGEEEFRQINGDLTHTSSTLACSCPLEILCDGPPIFRGQPHMSLLQDRF